MNYSINKNANRLLDLIIEEKDRLNLLLESGPMGCKIIDAGINTSGSIEAGIKISEICLGGLGTVNITPNQNTSFTNWDVSVYASHPVLACLGSQYAGWSLNHETFFSLGSGPVRSIAQKEKIFSALGYKDYDDRTCVILEVDVFPPKEIVQKIAKDCNIKPENISFILTPTTSICGNIQVVARVLEVAIHKMHELKFPLDRVIHGLGSAPLPPVANDFITGMGRTNDAIIYGGIVQLTIDGPEGELQELSKKLPSIGSKDYGKPFKKIFENYNKDFYKIDGSLFSPAVVIINSKQTGKSYSSGKINDKMIKMSFS